MDEMANGCRRERQQAQTILVVDDEEVVRSFMTRALLHAGYEVIDASNGWEALVLLQAGAVALVVTDIRMPEMGGLELGDQISRLPLPPPVVYASASDNPPRGMASWYLQKPFTAAELTAMVQEVLVLAARPTR